MLPEDQDQSRSRVGTQESHFDGSHLEVELSLPKISVSLLSLPLFSTFSLGTFFLIRTLPTKLSFFGSILATIAGSTRLASELATEATGKI